MNGVLIIGHARHGKDTVASILHEEYKLTFKSSSQAASEIFIYDLLKDKYGYKSPEECFDDRVNHRAEWYNLICDFNKNDRARLAKEIMKTSDIYVGMRDNAEIEECIRQGVFDSVIGVFDPRQPLESPDSFNINLWQKSDFIIPNAGTIEDLRRKIKNI
jgi:dephospho-CoA kinase